MLITGTDLEDAASVRFGSSFAPNFTVDSETQITAVAPPATAGPVAISVTTSAGSARSSGQFTYLTGPAPVSPAAASVCSVPKLRGRQLEAARRVLRAADCKVGRVVRKPAGATPKDDRIKWQQPGPGTVLAAGSKVTIGLG